MHDRLHHILESSPVEASAPCRVDMGGTLDIHTFNYPLRHLAPCTFNLAVSLRTRVRVLPYTRGRVKVSSRGFESAEFPLDEAPFSHPLGLMFAIAAYFRAGGIHIHIDSASPPRSALGGSSAAAVALVAVLSKVLREPEPDGLSRPKTALLAHGLEQSVAGVPCGLQDQLSAVYGGVNAWYWQSAVDGGPLYRKKTIFQKRVFKNLQRHFLLAYCGVPHESKDINGKWVREFLSGRNRRLWGEIVTYTHEFIAALSSRNFQDAADMMNRETDVRKQLTPDVVDAMGNKLTAAARKTGCGARFTGAGGGGCIWAVGERDDIRRLEGRWQEVLSEREGACLLDLEIDTKGLQCRP